MFRIQVNVPIIKSVKSWRKNCQLTRSKDPCWLWRRFSIVSKHTILSPVISHNGRTISARRFIYEKIHGPIEKHVRIYRTCSCMLCVNPKHLIAVRLYRTRKDFVRNCTVDKKRGCWIWHRSIARVNSVVGTGRRVARSYGVLSVGSLKNEYAHRFSYKLYGGKISRGKDIHASCGNSLCVNPKHLIMTTHSALMLKSWARVKRRTRE